MAGSVGMELKLVIFLPINLEFEIYFGLFNKKKQHFKYFLRSRVSLKWATFGLEPSSLHRSSILLLLVLVTLLVRWLHELTAADWHRCFTFAQSMSLIIFVNAEICEQCSSKCLLCQVIVRYNQIWVGTANNSHSGGPKVTLYTWSCHLHWNELLPVACYTFTGQRVTRTSPIFTPHLFHFLSLHQLQKGNSIY